MASIVTFGELMLRLAPPLNEVILQNHRFDATFGGSEANVAVSLSNYGEDAAFVSSLPSNDVGDAAISELKSFGVDTRCIRRVPDRIGVYYVQPGSNMRPSKVIYDRDNSAIALSKPGDFDWARILDGAQVFFFSGITPAVSKSLYEATLEALKVCKANGVMVACDLNFRNKLWRWGRRADEVMPELARYVSVLMANEEDCQRCLGIELDAGVGAGKIDAEKYRALSAKLFEIYPGLEHVAVSLRESVSADFNRWSGIIANRGGFYVSKKYEIQKIVDRVGGGDSFSAGIIRGLRKYGDAQHAIEFAVAASALKHTISGDYNRVKESDVESLAAGNTSGRIQR